MSVGGTAAWLLSALFTTTAACYAGTALVAVASSRLGGRRVAVNAGLHVLMSVAMIAMLWSWGSVIATITQVTVFTAAAAWYVALVVFGSRTRPGQGHDHHDAALGNLYHAGMMGSMVWMAVVMSAMSTPLAVATPASGGMAGMDDGPTVAGGGTSTAMSMPMPMGSAPGWIRSSCLVLGVVFLLGAAGYLLAMATRVVRRRNGATGAVLPYAIGAAMAVGMALVFLDMT